MNKHELADKIRTFGGLSDDERAELLKLLNRRKKYGLVWEEKPEAVEERLAEELPVLTEVAERAIVSPDTDAPNHILIEGDNLEALTTLAYTHEGKIDVIYIDPPYNTGNKDFVYNDHYVDAEDGYRHSKWLSFMHRRLLIAKQLLNGGGVIFISIDDNEQAQLKLLCDEVFGEKNFLACSVVNRASEIATDKIVSKHEYCLIYAKNIDAFSIDELNKETISRGTVGNIDQTMPEIVFPKGIKCYNIKDGIYHTTRKIVGSRENIENITPIIVENGELKEDAILKARWRSSNDMRKFFANNMQLTKAKISGYIKEIYFENDKFNPQIKKSTYEKISSIYLENKRGSKTLDDIGVSFPFPKYIGLIQYFLRFSKKSATILDFFAGSGTTLHATMQLNAEDGGHRKCILVTNNENRICEEVTYERNRRVIQGYTTPKGEAVEGLKGNTLRYYRTDFVPRQSTFRNMRLLVNKATDMLCIKENLYAEQPTFGRFKTQKGVFRHFAEDPRHMLVIYREEAIAELVEEIYAMEVQEPIKVYLFSPSDDPWEGSFEEVADKVQLCALPHAILNAYRRVLPKPKEPHTASHAENVSGLLFNTDEPTTHSEEATL